MATKENPAAIRAATGLFNLLCRRLALRRCRTAKQQPADKQQSIQHFLHRKENTNPSKAQKSTQKRKKSATGIFYFVK